MKEQPSKDFMQAQIDHLEEDMEMIHAKVIWLEKELKKIRCFYKDISSTDVNFQGGCISDKGYSIDPDKICDKSMKLIP